MKLYEITFSPTGGTRKVADLLTAALGGEAVSVDLMDSRADFAAVKLTPEDVAVIAVPSYGGRVPAPAAERLKAVQGGGARAVLVCVYGNRAYEDTLVELEDAALAAGFRVAAAVAAVAEHSIAHRYAAGRPDAQDGAQLQAFAGKIREKLSAGDDTAPWIPGNRPYKKPGGSGLVPKPTRACNNCGLCAEKCPVQAIDPGDPKHTQKDKCISCMGCVAVCPRSARKVSAVMLAAVDAALKKACSERKENELFL
jgi:ferredoxin/methylmalonyl-CoA mutase cobalamin-binding subunit